MVVTIIGLGLIGGSLGLCLRRGGWASKIIGVDVNADHQQEAMKRGLVDRVLPLDDSIASSDLIVLAVPAHVANKLLPMVLGKLDAQQTLMDVGSNKAEICAVADAYDMRRRFVPTHPMWGTEHSGPKAASLDAFKEKAVIICNQGVCDVDALKKVEQLYTNLGMHIVYMHARVHDMHAAYVSHISHISSFALSNTVLEKEKQESAILEMASSGFETTVRLAKSNVDTWTPVLLENREHILEVLDEYINQLYAIKDALSAKDEKKLHDLIVKSNEIKKILK